MNASDGAKIFYDWAIVEGFFPDGLPSAHPTPAAQFALLQPLTDAGRQILRAKQVQAVGFNEDRSEIIVFTKRAAPATKKQLASLPTQIDDLRIKYRQGVQNPIGHEPAVPFGAPPFAIRQNPTGDNFYSCGSSISVGNNREAGTLGCLVRNPQGELYGLSNNHVSGSCSYAPVGLPIVAPGIVDVAANSLAPFTIGFHTSALTLVAGTPDNVAVANNLDAAIFKIHNVGNVTSFQRTFYDTPLQTMPLTGNMTVEKVGRTTGHTSGTVISQIYGPFSITYACQMYGFSGQVFFDPLFSISGQGNLFSDGGDSGSLITHVNAAGERFAVGIVVGGMTDGGAPGGKVTLALPIEPILQQLNVQLVGGHNV